MNNVFLKGVAAAFLLSVCLVNGQVIVSDNYNVTGSGTGFGLNAGVNTGIYPSPTRLTGTSAANLRYIDTALTKPTTAYAITGSKLRITPAVNPGRFTLSADGTMPFNFASALGTGAATPANPVVYDISIKMANISPGTPRFSFALAATEGDATTWDFGIQLYRTSGSDTFYTIQKRIDIAASGLASDLNEFITYTALGTYGTELTFLIRVTDAGSETTTYNSRVQVSVDGGLNWFYDTETDADLTHGWRLNGAGRYILWDAAPNAGDVTYDNFSMRTMPLAVTLVSPANNISKSGATANLIASVSNKLSGNLTVKFFGREAPENGPGSDFLLPVLPDTQNYAREDSSSGHATKEMWYAQTDWIINNRVSKNIPYVATLGDCVNTATVLSQWKIATNAYYRMESPSQTLLPEGIPYGVTVGNHDQSPNGDEDGDSSKYNQYFGTSHFQNKSYYGGSYTSSDNDTWYDLFSASGLDFLVISFEYGRYGATVLQWARNLMSSYPTRRVIVLTHHAGDDNSDVNATSTPFSTQGQAIYTGLKTNANFFLMLGAHVFDEGGEGRRTDTFQGNTVHTLISDYQGRFNGGNGLMRLMYFSPSNNLVSVKTYSPYTGNFETDANSQFSFTYNMQAGGTITPETPYAALGTNLNVAPDTQTSFVWGNLQSGKTYQWYAAATDEFGATTIGSPRMFTVTGNAPPVASNQTVTVVGDQPIQVTLPASDPNGDALTYQTNGRPYRGLTADFNSTNGTLTYLPGFGFRGSDLITFQVNDTLASSSLGTLTLNVTAPPDSNTNGLPDAWETKYGVTNPDGDDDGDGQNNLAEYMADTNPTYAASNLKIIGAVFQLNGDLGLTWASVGGSRYRVQYSNATNGGISGTFNDIFRPVDVEIDPSPYGASSTQTYIDTDADPNSARYYRVKAVP